MAEEELKEAIEGLQDDIQSLTSAVSGLQKTIYEFHWGDRGLRSLVDRIGSLNSKLEDLTKVIRSKRR